jgi:hypothetical protein
VIYFEGRAYEYVAPLKNSWHEHLKNKYIYLNNKEQCSQHGGYRGGISSAYCSSGSVKMASLMQTQPVLLTEVKMERQDTKNLEG